MFTWILLVRFDDLGVEWKLAPSQVERLRGHYSLLIKWNRVINLTRVEAEAEVVQRHYGESLFLASHLPQGSYSIADVGSGGGFPGVPVAVARPELSVTLIESDQRKAAFLKEATRGWGNVRVLAQRAELVTETFDWIVSRAVSNADLAKFAARLAPRSVVLASDGTIPLPWDPSRFLRFT